MKKKYKPIQINLLKFLTINEIETLILNNLSDDLLKKEWKNKENKINTTGHCYHASEALMYLSGGKEIWSSVVGKDDFNSTHWWLKNKETLKILDVTRSQYYNLGKIPPYNNGKPKGFQQQSFSCLKLMKKVLNNLDIKNIERAKIIKLIDLKLTKNKKNCYN